jgi:hypothetical protein
MPRPVARWLLAMSTRVGAPRDRVLRVLLDGYTDQLPDGLRKRLQKQAPRVPEPRRPQ